MEVEIEKAIRVSLRFLTESGFSLKDARLITKNLIDAEMSGKKTHGLIRLKEIKKQVDSGVIKTQNKIEVVRSRANCVYVKANHKPAFIPLYLSLDIAIKKAKKSGLCVVGIKDAEYGSGFIGSYARIAALANLVFIGFNNSPSVLVPHGTKKALWGTNPVTVGIPSENDPVILDMASTQITWGDLMIARQKGKQIKEGVAIDKTGKETTDPVEAMSGGLLPFAGHKGSGLAFVVELLAGAMTGSRVGRSVSGGWGASYILIDPRLFRRLGDFKRDVKSAVEELKSSPRRSRVKQVYFPGEKSQIMRRLALEKGSFEVDEKLYWELEEFVGQGK